MVEYRFEIFDGAAVAGNPFFTMYFVMTGLHFLHVLIATTSVPQPVTYAILLLAAAKVAVVMSEFMELRIEPKGWRIAAAAWLVAVSAILLVTFT